MGNLSGREPIHIDQQSLSQWHADLRDGDSEATRQLWELYFERMVAVARKKLPQSRRQARDEEDIALSAFKSFCLGLQKGKFTNEEDQLNLWPLLLTLTVNKAIDQIRQSNRLKRGGTGTAEIADGAVAKLQSSKDVLDHLAGRSPSPELVAATNDAFAWLLASLDQSGDEQLKEIAVASFDGETPQEISKRLDCSARTVQRKLRTIKAIWESGQ